MYFTEEHEVFRESFKDFLQKEVVPHIEKWEKTGRYRTFYLDKVWRYGLFWIKLPRRIRRLESGSILHGNLFRRIAKN